MALADLFTAGYVLGVTVLLVTVYTTLMYFRVKKREIKRTVGYLSISNAFLFLTVLTLGMTLNLVTSILLPGVFLILSVVFILLTAVQVKRHSHLIRFK